MIHSRCLLLALMLLGLSACTLMSRPEPASHYRLPPVDWRPSDQAALTQTLRISRPAASISLAGSRILVMTESHRFEAYKGARWVSPLPQLWRDWLVDSFTRDGGIPTIVTDGDPWRADWELSGTIGAFQVEYHNGLPQAVVRFDAHLADIGSGDIVAARRFEASAIAAGEDVAAVIAALGEASDTLGRDLLDWLMATIEKPIDSSATP